MKELHTMDDSRRALANFAGSHLESLVKEHSKAAKVLLYGALSLFFGYVCVHEIAH